MARLAAPIAATRRPNLAGCARGLVVPEGGWMGEIEDVGGEIVVRWC